MMVQSLGLEVTEKTVFIVFFLIIFFYLILPNYATDWNRLKNYQRGPYKVHFCQVGSKSSQMFIKAIVDDPKHTTDDTQQTSSNYNSSPSADDSGQVKIGWVFLG